MPTSPDQPPCSATTQLIGDRVRQARLAEHLTQEELANLHFSKSYVSAVERGKTLPSFKALGILAERLGVSRASLLGEEVHEPLIEATKAPVENGELAEQLRKAEQILQEGRFEEALALLEQIGQRDRTSRVHAQYAQFLADQGRFQEAYQQMRLALQRQQPPETA